MAKTIEGVPESITREQWLSALRSLGIDPSRSSGIRGGLNGIYVALIEPDPSWDGEGDLAPSIPERGPEGSGYGTVARHTVFIPFIDSNEV